MNISHAAPEDAPAIARVQVRSWQVAYENILPTAHLATLTTEKREAMWRESISRGSPQLLVARDDDGIVGFVAFGTCRDENAAADRAEDVHRPTVLTLEARLCDRGQRPGAIVRSGAGGRRGLTGPWAAARSG